MSAHSEPDWLEANQRQLNRELAEVRGYLTAGGEVTGDGDQSEVLDRRDDAQVSALDSLCQLFGLSDFERDCLLLCAGMELDSGFAADCLETLEEIAVENRRLYEQAGGSGSAEQTARADVAGQPGDATSLPTPAPSNMTMLFYLDEQGDLAATGNGSQRGIHGYGGLTRPDVGL